MAHWRHGEGMGEGMGESKGENDMTVIYHNPRCSKSRAALALLQENDIALTIVRYLDDPPDAATLADIAQKLKCSMRDIIRSGEARYRELGLDVRELSDAELCEVVAANPQLLERPIVVCGDKAAVGRPPENVLAVIK